jgi:hypothetical protein
MTLDDMRTLYLSVMGFLLEDVSTATFTLRVWDGMDGCWCDVVANVELAFALQRWCKETADGTKKTNYSDIDYYRIFPADTKMLWSGDFTMRGEEDER